MEFIRQQLPETDYSNIPEISRVEDAYQLVDEIL